GRRPHRADPGRHALGGALGRRRHAELLAAQRRPQPAVGRLPPRTGSPPPALTSRTLPPCAGSPTLRTLRDMPESHARRRDALRTALRDQQLDALLVTDL